jgi:hypothetical protein
LFVAQLLKTCHITNRRIQPNIEVFTLYTWTYSSTELNNAKSAISGATPITKDSEHYFFDLPQFEANR